MSALMVLLCRKYNLGAGGEGSPTEGNMKRKWIPHFEVGRGVANVHELSYFSRDNFIIILHLDFISRTFYWK